MPSSSRTVIVPVTVSGDRTESWSMVRRMNGGAGWGELARAALADGARQALGAAVPRSDAELHFRLAELGGVAGDADVARHGQFAAAAQGEAVDGGNHRFAARLEAPQHALAAQRP